MENHDTPGASTSSTPAPGDRRRRNRLYHAALSGDYATAKIIIDHNPNILREDILQSGRMETVLHVAVGAKQTHFVKQLLHDYYENENEVNVSQTDINGNTAFFSACAAGDLEIVNNMMRTRWSMFITTPGGRNASPLSIAVSFGHGEVASRLYDETKKIPNYFSHDLKQEHRYGIFFDCINNDLYDLALEMLENDTFAGGVENARGDKNLTALHLLSRKPPSVFATPKTQGLWSTRCSRLFCKSPRREESKALKLVKKLWNRTLEAKNYNYREITRVIQTPIHLLMEATKVGNLDFLVVLTNSYPELIWELYEEKVFHFAVEYRQVEIFKLIHEVGLSKQLVQSYEDDEGNNLLHIAALKPPDSRLRSIVGSALQMREQILWFQEVRKIVIPSLRNKKNSVDKTPQDLFTKNHNGLMKESEKWMKRNANICLLVATIIVTVIFQANYDISGDDYDKAGSKSPIIKYILLISHNIAMCTSSLAVMLNLFIITSRFSEEDLFRPLPYAFIGGIVSLCIAMTFMLTSFCLTYFIASKSLAIRICACFLEFLPVILFLYLVKSMFDDLNISTFFSNSKFKHGKRVLGCYYEKEENGEAILESIES